MWHLLFIFVLRKYEIANFQVYRIAEIKTCLQVVWLSTNNNEKIMYMMLRIINLNEMKKIIQQDDADDSNWTWWSANLKMM